MRTPSVLTTGALLASTGAVCLAPQVTASAADTIPSTAVTWCAATPAPPCIDSATLNGADIEPLSDWQLSGQAFTVGGSDEISMSLMHDDGGGFDYELGAASLDDVVVVELLTGALRPRLVTGKARNTSVVRSGSGASQEVRVTGTPVLVSGQCDQAVWPWVCPEYTGTDPEHDREWVGSFNFNVSDVGGWDDAAQRDAFHGMNYFTNVAATSVPPEITGDPATLLIRLANRHFRSDGETVVKGHGELRIPNAFLEAIYGIPDPATMTGTSLLPSLSGGGPGFVTSMQEAGGQAMSVTYSGVEFSTRQLRVRVGVIKPTRVEAVETARITKRKGRVTLVPAEPRGARVTGYRTRCVSQRGHVVVVTGATTSVAVPGLRRRTAYDCKGRALSKAGAGRWSPIERMPAKPPVT